MGVKAKEGDTPAGRPTKYSDAVVDHICDKISSGKSLVDICRPDDMPGRSTVFRWLAEESNKTFRDMYTRAREAQADALFDDLVDIADNATNDWMDANAPGDAGRALNGEALQRSRLRVDTRKWAASKLKPRKYGDRIHNELSGPNGGAIPIAKVEQLTDEQLQAIATNGSQGTPKKA